MCDLALYQGTTLVVPKVPQYEWALAPAYSRRYAFICDAMSSLENGLYSIRHLTKESAAAGAFLL
jgi:hypothetical protein